MDAKGFEELKAKIADSKAKKERLVGQLDGIISRMKSEFGCETVKDLEAKQVELHNQVTELDAAFAKGMEELEKSIDWSSL